MERIVIGNVEIEVTFKNIKNLHLSVHPPYGKVTVASPEIYDLEKVKIYIATKLGWIKKEQKRFQEQPRETTRIFKNQESHYFFGSRYLLQLTQGTSTTTAVKGNKLIITSKRELDPTAYEKQLYAFYRSALRKYLEISIAKYAAIMQINIPIFSIRAMKTKWGSCATTNNRLWFNIELAKKPLDCIDYVVVHELVHLIERNHNKRFVLLMNEYFPNWRTQKKILNELPLK